jgi:hypothetical protein
MTPEDPEPGERNPGPETAKRKTRTENPNRTPTATRPPPRSTPHSPPHRVYPGEVASEPASHTALSVASGGSATVVVKSRIPVRLGEPAQGSQIARKSGGKRVSISIRVEIVSIVTIKPGCVLRLAQVARGNPAAP